LRSFMLGFYKDGELETDLKEIAKHYVMTFFTLDLVLLGCALRHSLCFLISGVVPASVGGRGGRGGRRGGPFVLQLGVTRISGPY